MKLKISVGLLIIFGFTEIRPLLPYIDYFINYDYIAEVLCINKEKPQSTCNGKCYLKQQIKEQQPAKNHDKKLPIIKQERIPMILFTVKLPWFFLGDNKSNSESTYYPFLFNNRSLKPPTPPPQY